MREIFGSTRSPYYVYAPRWLDTSAGIRALHYLCHALNQNGEDAYIASSEPFSRTTSRVSGLLHTPLLTNEILASHKASGRLPITIYAETVLGNPLNAGLVVRLLLNYSGALGGQQIFQKNEKVWAFSQAIASDYELRSGTKVAGKIFIPPIDPREFNSSPDKDDFQLVYAGKYRDFVGEPFNVGELPSIEIFRDGPRKQSRKEVISLLARAKVLYSFENSSIVTEAILSGTPAVFVPNEFLGQIIGEDELGAAGVATDLSKDSLASAAASVNLGREQYLKRVSEFGDSITKFRDATQAWSKQEELSNETIYPTYSKSKIIASKWRSAVLYAKRNGIGSLAKEAFSYVKKLI